VHAHGSRDAGQCLPISRESELAFALRGECREADRQPVPEDSHQPQHPLPYFYVTNAGDAGAMYPSGDASEPIMDFAADKYAFDSSDGSGFHAHAYTRSVFADDGSFPEAVGECPFVEAEGVYAAYGSGNGGAGGGNDGIGECATVDPSSLDGGQNAYA
jgi:hypothetical protein